MTDFEETFDECAQTFCKNNGSYLVKKGLISCDCRQTGYTGIRCIKGIQLLRPGFHRDDTSGLVLYIIYVAGYSFG